MNKNLILSMLLALPAAAAEPVITEKDELAFAGHFGEVLRYKPQYGVRAAMHAGREVVLFYPRAQGEPKSDSIKPDQFASGGYMELMVVPKNAKSLSLQKLCQRRWETLHADRSMRFTSAACTPGHGCALPGVDWPANSCEFRIEQPYALEQLFTETKDAFFILSSGPGFGSEPGITTALSLMRSVNPIEKDPESLSMPRYEYRKAGVASPWRKLLPDGFWLRIWLALNGALLALGVLPGWAQARRAAVAAGAALAGNGFVVLGLLIAALEHAAGLRLVNNWLAMVMPLALAVPAAAWLVAARLRAKNPAKVAAAAALAALPLLLLALYARKDPMEAPLLSGPTAAYLILPWAGLLIGAASGGAVRLRALALCALMVFGACPASAQSPTQMPPQQDELEAMARVRASRAARGERYHDLQRVEVTGIWSADDLTPRKFEGMFDHHITPSHFKDLELEESGVMGWVRQRLKETRPRDNDLRDMQKDSDGQLSDRAKQALAPLVGKDVNELVCHSWGSELVYTAIMRGYIKSPSRIIVLGPPDTNTAKWKALTKWTGASVVYIKSPDDHVANSGSLRPAAIPTDPYLLDGEWAKTCVTAPDYDRCRVKKGQGAFVDHSAEFARMQLKTGATGHDRLLYYEAMRGLEPSTGVSAWDLGQAQYDEVSKEILRAAEETSIPGDGLAQLAPELRDAAARMKAIEEGARILEERKRREALLPKADAPREPEPVKLPQATLNAEVAEAIKLGPISAAKWLARRACTSRFAIDQYTMNFVTRQLADYINRPDIAMMREPDSTCEEQIYNKIVAVAQEGRLLNTDWVRTRAAQRKCVDESKSPTSQLYKGLMPMARNACYFSGVTSADMASIASRKFSAMDPYTPMSSMAQCIKDVYFLLCVGDPNGKPWSAAVINEKGKAYAARDEAEKGGGSYMGGGGVTSEDRTERLESHDFSRPNALIPTYRSPW